MNITIELPNTLSGLLRVAVNDAKLCEADPKFQLNMSNWVEASYEDDSSGNPMQCHVCMAGAVLVQRSGVPLGALYGYVPDDDPGETDRKMVAINDLRVGAVSRAYSHLHGCNGFIWFDELPADKAGLVMAARAEIDKTYRGGRASWGSYESAADLLEQAGL